MNRISRLLATAFSALLLLPLTAAAQGGLTASEAFSKAPRKVIPLLDENARLDMIDYFNSNMNNPTDNSYGGKSRILSMTPQDLTAQLTDASLCQLSVLPASGSPLIALITTVATPTPDSRMSVYTSDWSRDVTASVFTKPTLADWLTDEGKKHSDEVEMTVPFLLISYTYDPATSTLTLTNNSAQFLGADVYEPVSGYVLPKIEYRFNGKRFSRLK